MKKKIMPPTYFFVLLVILVILHIIVPVSKIIPTPYNYFGILFIVFGCVINVITDNLFKHNKTTVKPHENPTSFITSGPFRISRHPMYLGMLSILLGVAILFGSLTAFIPCLIFIILMEIMFIPIEEKNLEKEFGNKYLEYKKRVGRWI